MHLESLKVAQNLIGWLFWEWFEIWLAAVVKHLCSSMKSIFANLMFVPLASTVQIWPQTALHRYKTFCIQNVAQIHIHTEKHTWRSFRFVFWQEAYSCQAKRILLHPSAFLQDLQSTAWVIVRTYRRRFILDWTEPLQEPAQYWDQASFTTCFTSLTQLHFTKRLC